MCIFAISSCNKIAVEQPETNNATAIQNAPAAPKLQTKNEPQMAW